MMTEKTTRSRSLINLNGIICNGNDLFAYLTYHDVNMYCCCCSARVCHSIFSHEFRHQFDFSIINSSRLQFYMFAHFVSRDLYKWSKISIKCHKMQSTRVFEMKKKFLTKMNMNKTEKLGLLM